MLKEKQDSVVHGHPPAGHSASPEGSSDRLWVQLVQSSWTSVALVPTAAGMSGRALGEALAKVGSDYRGRSVLLIDAERLSRAESRAVVERLAAAEERHALVVTIDAPVMSQSALLVARAVDAAVLLVGLERTTLADARRTVEMLGKEKILGGVTIAPRSRL